MSQIQTETSVLYDGDVSNQGFKIWDFRTGAVSDFAWTNPDDKPGGHIDMGALWFVNGDGWNTGILVRSYAAMHGAANLLNIVQYKRSNGLLNWTIADHLSMRNDDETFVVGSTYGGDGTWDAFEDEIYLAYTNGTGFVRLAHSRSAQNFSDPGLNYYASPRAVVDRFGHFIVYSSDLGSTNRIDVMILKIPQALWPSGPLRRPCRLPCLRQRRLLRRGTHQLPRENRIPPFKYPDRLNPTSPSVPAAEKPQR